MDKKNILIKGYKCILMELSPESILNDRLKSG